MQDDHTHGGGGRGERRRVVAPEIAGFESRPLPEKVMWLAGFLEGEGSFFLRSGKYAVISAVSTDRDIIERAATLLGCGYRQASRRAGKEHWKTAWVLTLTGERALDWMQRLRPFMGVRRREAIDLALANARHRKRLPIEALAERFGSGERAVDLAAEYGVTREAIYRAIKRHATAVGHPI